MGYHNALAGADLHEPSRLRILNSTSAILVPGNVVSIIGRPSVFGVVTVTELASENAAMIGFVDSFINRGTEGTVVFLGKVYNVEVEADTFDSGDFIAVGSAGTIQKTIRQSERIGTVLYIESPTTSTRMDIFINSTNTVDVPLSRSGAVQLNTAFIEKAGPRETQFASGTTGVQSLGYNVGFTQFGRGLTNTSGHDSFTLVQSTAAGADAQIYDKIRISRDGIYELTVDPYIYITGALLTFEETALVGSFSNYNVDFITAIKVLRKSDSVVETLFSNRRRVFSDIVLKRSVSNPIPRLTRGAMSWFSHDLFGYLQDESNLGTDDTRAQIEFTGTDYSVDNIQLNINLTNGNGTSTNVALTVPSRSAFSTSAEDFAANAAAEWNRNANVILSEYTASQDGAKISLRPNSNDSDFNITTLTVVFDANLPNVGIVIDILSPILPTSVEALLNTAEVETLMLSGDRPRILELKDGDEISMDFTIEVDRITVTNATQVDVTVPFRNPGDPDDFSNPVVAGFGFKQVDYIKPTD